MNLALAMGISTDIYIAPDDEMQTLPLLFSPSSNVPSARRLCINPGQKKASRRVMYDGAEYEDAYGMGRMDWPLDEPLEYARLSRSSSP